MDLDALKPEVEAIGKSLIDSGTLTPEERTKVAKWTLAMGIALSTGDVEAVGNYRQSISMMIGVAELRATQAAEKAALQMADLAIGVITKVALAAI